MSNSIENQKASLFNLIVYANEKTKSSHFETLLSTILSKFPVHLIYINEQPHEPPVIAADNRIILELDQGDLSKAPFIVLPHIIPDLPIYLLWGENPSEEKIILPSIQKWAKRLIFDCKPFKDLAYECIQLLEFIEGSSFDIVDMNWARVAGWRQVISQVFDSDEKLQGLYQATSIKIVFKLESSDVNEHPEIQALFLVGWLANQLKWILQKSDKTETSFVYYFEGSKGSLQVEILPSTEGDFPTDEILSMSITSKDGQTFDLLRSELSQVIVHWSTKELCYLPYSLNLANLGKGRQFLTELLYRPVSENYFHLLKWMSLYGTL